MIIKQKNKKQDFNEKNFIKIKQPKNKEDGKIWILKNLMKNYKSFYL